MRELADLAEPAESTDLAGTTGQTEPVELAVADEPVDAVAPVSPVDSVVPVSPVGSVVLAASVTPADIAGSVMLANSAVLAAPAGSASPANPKEPVELSIALAEPEDMPALLVLYADVVEAVTGTDNDPLWVLGLHPSKEGLAGAIEAGTLLVGWCEENGVRTLAAALVANDEVAEGYENVAWRVPAAPDEVCVIHLFTVHPAFQRRGFARRMLDAAQDFAREQGKRVIRLDTLANNKGAQRVYDRYGFDNLGYANLVYEDTRVTDFVMYELAL